MTRPVALTIAGSDSGGGAGIVADLKTFEAHDVWGTAAIVAVTAQNTVGVQAVETLTPALVKAQIESVVSDIGVDAAKTGMLASAELTRTVAACLRDLGVANLVVDPVLVSKHGDALLTDDAVGALVSDLIPLATVVTPNLPEASRLVGIDVDSREAMAEAGTRIVDMGARVALVKGGHLGGEDSPDCLVSLDDGVTWLEAGRIPGRHTHGTGCVLSAAITAELARGMEPADACVAAKRFLERAIASGLDLGSGIGPVNPGWARNS